MKHTYNKYDIKELQERCFLLCNVLMKSCRYRLVEVQPPICTFFHDGPRYRQECSMRACPAIEKEKDGEILVIKSKDVGGLLPSGELSEEDTYGTFTKRTAGEKEQE